MILQSISSPSLIISTICCMESNVAVTAKSLSRFTNSLAFMLVMTAVLRILSKFSHHYSSFSFLLNYQVNFVLSTSHFICKYPWSCARSCKFYFSHDFWMAILQNFYLEVHVNVNAIERQDSYGSGKMWGKCQEIW